LRVADAASDKPPTPPRRGLRRALRLRLAIGWYVVRRLGPWLGGVTVYALLATVLIRWEERRAGATPADFTAALYGVCAQLFFEFDTLPPTPLARVIYFVSPLVGVVLIAEGLLKVGASLIDSQSRVKVLGEIVSSQMHQHIVLCGLGHVGYRVLSELRRLGEDVVCVERDEKASFVDQVRAMGIPVHIGDARRDDLIKSAGVERAKAIVCATNDDLANLEIALDAKRMNPEVRVVMRMFDQRLAGKVGGALELDQSFSTSAVAAPLIAIQATQDGVHAAYRLDDVVRVTAEVSVGARFAESTVTAFEGNAPCRVVGRRAAGEAAFKPAAAADAVRAGDVLMVDTSAVDLPAVRYRLGG
jgi:Trk K+ transport system NAD-binding subunit